MFKQMMQRALLLVALVVPGLAVANAPATPQQVVQGTIDQVIEQLNTRREEFRQDPEAFYSSLNGILGPVVDFEGFARGVMTVRYSRRASAEQFDTFQENFKRSLMQFYGNALLEYENQEIRMLGTQPSQEPGRAAVNMEIVGVNGVVYPLSYTMTLDGDQWKLRNVVVNGINIGKLFRDQFADAMNRNGNDLNKVIENWADDVARSRSVAEQAADQ